jgi:hypothetical protein
VQNAKRRLKDSLSIKNWTDAESQFFAENFFFIVVIFYVGSKSKNYNNKMWKDKTNSFPFIKYFFLLFYNWRFSFSIAPSRIHQHFLLGFKFNSV